MREGASKDIASELTQASRCCVAVPELPVRVAPPALCLACREAHTRRSPAGLEGDNRCRGARFDAHLRERKRGSEREREAERERERERER